MACLRKGTGLGIGTKARVNVMWHMHTTVPRSHVGVEHGLRVAHSGQGTLDGAAHGRGATQDDEQVGARGEHGGLDEVRGHEANVLQTREGERERRKREVVCERGTARERVRSEAEEMGGWGAEGREKGTVGRAG